MTGRSPSELYGELTARYGAPAYARIDTAASREQKAVLARLSPDQVSIDQLGGEPTCARYGDLLAEDSPARQLLRVGMARNPPPGISFTPGIPRTLMVHAAVYW